jgi:hypothetical protein
MMVCGILVVLGRDLVVVAALVRLRAHVSSPLVRLSRRARDCPCCLTAI